MRAVNRTQGAIVTLCDFQLRSDLETETGRDLDASSGEQAQDEEHQENHDENEEENTRDVRARSRDPGKTKNRRHNRDEKKYESPFK
jgi:hypothetical protein